MTAERPITGVVPVMLTPFEAGGGIDWEGYAALIEWYLANGADALFAVCQSSEMQHLTLEERVALAEFAVRAVNGRVPVLASGHVAESFDDQRAELRRMADTGIDVLVMVTNRLASSPETGDAALLEHLRGLMAELPRELALGLYECPSPYRRLLSDEHVRFCAGSGRFVALKDVSCDLATVSRRCAIAEGSPFAIVNANAAIAWEAVRAGSRGFCGITNNFYPDLYAWLLAEGGADRPHAAELAAFLGICGMVELLGYPAVAKRFHQRLGTFASTMCRSVPPDVLEHHWALDALLDQMNVGAEFHRDRTTRARVGTARQTR